MIRDNEINRLIKYAQGLNTTVKFKQKKEDGDADGGWTIDGSEITIYTTPTTPKIYTVLCLIHEIAHHLEHIHGNNRELDEKLDEALEPEEANKRQRKKLYDWEIKSSLWWETIFKETDCQFNINKLYAERDFDLYQYETYYETGEYPTSKEKKQKWNELKEKYRK
jgi:hypothetical protein